MDKIRYASIQNNKDLMLPSVDYVFCRLFGSEKRKYRLISLLNAILNGKPYIKDVTIDPTEFKKTYVDGKTIRLDIKATTDDGTIINVEMQCVDTKYVIYRAELYQAMMLQDIYIKAGETFKNIPNRISIWICKSDAVDRPGCIHEVLAMFKATKFAPVAIASEKYRCIVIELTKLNEYDDKEVGEMFKPWMSFVDDPQHLPDNVLSIGEVQEAVEELEFLSHDSETRTDYVYRMKEINDMINAKSEGYEDGKADGIEIGIKKGIKKGIRQGEEIGIKKGIRQGEEIGIKKGEEIGARKMAIKIAKNALAVGLTPQQAAEISSLEIEEIYDIMRGI